ncbi:fibronectin type III domain-containing protein [Microbacterium sp. ZW T6_19]|uniref:fibronectin type III domain-containing protein n=1 Tax=Microbacterium sp. ZW T6_19 TaxID=3378082 RepID=UPI003854F281
MSSLTASAHRRPARRSSAWIAAAAVGATLVLSGLVAAPATAASTAQYTGIVLGVGANESQRIVTWYSTADEEQLVQLAPTASVVNGEFPATAKTFTATGTANITSVGGVNRHTTLTGLEENTAYTYRVGSEGNWSTAYSFSTQSFDGDFDFLFFGDPQIGASGNVANDGAGWSDTLDVALGANPTAELLVSGGDQVETANTETQWDAFLASDKLRQYPWVATIGNHDVGGKAYEQHLYTPNTDRSAKYYANGDPASNTSGGDYWFIYKDVLFIDLNSNSYKTTDGTNGDAAHVAYVTDVINQHGAEAKHTVLVYHHAIYSAASHAKDADNKVRRVDFPTVFSNLGVDLVLQGHDHVYTRSYEIKNGEKANPDEQPGQDEIFVGPGGVVYMTANSASGSKYYNITAPDASGTSGAGNGADPLNPSSYWYNSVQSQEKTRSYVQVKVRDDKLIVEDIRSEASGSNPVLSVVDSVTINANHGDGQDIQVDVPESAPGEFGWTIDGTNRLVDLGTAVEKDNTYFTASGEINPITVTDTRKTHSGWSISASVGDFTDGAKVLSGKYLGWTPSVKEEGAGTIAGAPIASGYTSGTGLSESRALAGAWNGHELGASKVGAGLELTFPNTTEKGAYRATLTLTALAG